MCHILELDQNAGHSQSFKGRWEIVLTNSIFSVIYQQTKTLGA